MRAGDRWERLVREILDHKAALPSEPAERIDRGERVDLVQGIHRCRSRGVTPIIAELKPKSPSEGRLRDLKDLQGIVREVEESDVAGVSVLTEERFFGGSKALLSEVARLTDLPILRKDFLTRPEELVESRRIGADSVLLIARLLGNELGDMYRRSIEVGVQALVEVHTEEEMARATNLGVGLIGINNRDLTDFSIDLETTIRLAPKAPPGSTVVSESGYASRDDIERMEVHCDAFLVGSAIMRSRSIKDKIRELQGRR